MKEKKRFLKEFMSVMRLETTSVNRRLSYIWRDWRKSVALCHRVRLYLSHLLFFPSPTVSVVAAFWSCLPVWGHFELSMCESWHRVNISFKPLCRVKKKRDAGEKELFGGTDESMFSLPSWSQKKKKDCIMKPTRTSWNGLTASDPKSNDSLNCLILM